MKTKTNVEGRYHRRLRARLISLGTQHRSQQPAQVSAQDQFFRGIRDVRAQHFSELRSETPASHVAAINDTFGAEFPYRHFHESRGWIRTRNLRRHILRGADDADAALPVAARVDANELHPSLRPTHSGEARGYIPATSRAQWQVSVSAQLGTRGCRP